MNAEERIVRALALRLAAKVARKTALALRKMTDKLALGDDTGLENAWEEVCVQIQYEQSVLWDAYEDTINAIILTHIEKLEPYEMIAIWLQTDEGLRWQVDCDDRQSPPFSCGEIVEYVRCVHLFDLAGRYTNRRILDYLNNTVRQD
jgi:hypothetical protein